MDENNIPIVLNVLWAKNAEQEQDFNYSEMRYRMLKDEHDQLLKTHEELKRKHSELVDKLNAFCTGRAE